MCGRYQIKKPPHVLEAEFSVTKIQLNLEPRWNVAPTQSAPVISFTPSGRQLAMMRWGLIPRWAKSKADGAKCINARSETVATAPSFRDALKQRRCLVPADGFIEWRAEGKVKQPYLFEMKDGAVFAFAGLWEQWTSPEGEAVESFTIITGPPNELTATIHDRMPVILPADQYAPWLDAEGVPVADVLPLLRPYPPEGMTVRPISRRINSPAHDGPALNDAPDEAKETPAPGTLL